MAVYQKGAETWCECDNCHLTLFAGFDTTANEIKRGFSRDGWTIGKRVLCDVCAKDPGWIHRETERLRAKFRQREACIG